MLFYRFSIGLLLAFYPVPLLHQNKAPEFFRNLLFQTLLMRPVPSRYTGPQCVLQLLQVCSEETPGSLREAELAHKVLMTLQRAPLLQLFPQNQNPRKNL